MRGEFAFAAQSATGLVHVKARKEGLVVSLRELGFYDSASSTMRASSIDAIDGLAAVRSSCGASTRIEGHIDDVPIHNSHFPSNWELPTFRATELVKLFTYCYHVVPSRLSAAEFAEFHPVAENTSMDGRASNCRMEIVILNPAISDLMSPLSSSPQAITSPSFLRQNRHLLSRSLLAHSRLNRQCDGFP